MLHEIGNPRSVWKMQIKTNIKHHTTPSAMWCANILYNRENIQKVSQHSILCGLLGSYIQFSSHTLIIQILYELKAACWNKGKKHTAGQTLTKKGTLVHNQKSMVTEERKRVGLGCLSCGEGWSSKKEGRPPSLEFLTSTDMTENRT